MHLLFVYNAKSDKLSAAFDFVHKIVSPSTYACDLCAITYGNFKMKEEWGSFLSSLPIETIFLYKDQFIKQFKIENSTFPAVYLVKDNSFIKSIYADQMKGMDLADLMQTVRGLLNVQFEK